MSPPDRHPNGDPPPNRDPKRDPNRNPPNENPSRDPPPNKNPNMDPPPNRHPNNGYSEQDSKKGSILLLTRIQTWWGPGDSMEICQECPGSVQDFSEVALYCKRLPMFVLHARCCLNENDNIVGLDLQNCSLKDPGPNFPQALGAVVIDLQANPLEDNLTDLFHGFLRLQRLVLPRDVQCPGGMKAWDNVTDDKDNRTCLGQRNLCNNTKDPEMCPENGSCAPNGPGFTKCVCAEGFHGYKCMRQDSFPLFMFFGILGSVTFTISSLLWGTQRRKAKAS